TLPPPLTSAVYAAPYWSWVAGIQVEPSGRSAPSTLAPAASVTVTLAALVSAPARASSTAVETFVAPLAGAVMVAAAAEALSEAGLVPLLPCHVAASAVPQALSPPSRIKPPSAAIAPSARVFMAGTPFVATSMGEREGERIPALCHKGVS